LKAGAKSSAFVQVFSRPNFYIKFDEFRIASADRFFLNDPKFRLRGGVTAPSACEFRDPYVAPSAS
jgi:hypothetical protein